MKNRPVLFITLLALTFVVRAEIPPAEKLLPKDTLAFYTIPDAARLRTAFASSPQGQLWNDPAIRAFKEKFVSKFTEDILVPLEKQLGVKFADYEPLAQGQFTAAVVQNGWQGNPGEDPALILLLDTRDKSDQLKKVLADLRKKWTDAGQAIKTEKIRDIEFSTLMVSSDDLTKSLGQTFPGFGGPKPDVDDLKSLADKPAPKTKTGVTIGQTESLLIVGTVPAAIEKVLIRLSGGLVPALIEDPVYEANHNALFRDAHWFGWVNARVLIDVLNQQIKKGAAGENPILPNPDKIVAKLGLNGLKSFAVSYRDSAEGSLVQFFAGVPEAGRLGLFKILAAEAKPSGPPAFVPIDAVKFNRWRLDGQKTWNGLEALITSISAEAGGAFKLIFENAGKDKDPKYDLRSELVGNLGDDIITYDKAPRSATLADLNTPPSITLFASPKADRLAGAIKVLLNNFGGSELKEREFLGRKVFSIALPGVAADPDGKLREFSFAASGGYLAVSSDPALFEEYLRGADNKPKPLSETPGLTEAAQKVGGMETGLFGFANNAEEMKAFLEMLKKDASTFDSLLGFSPPSSKDSSAPTDAAKVFKDWFDVSLLPPFDALAKYFHFTVFGGAYTPDGFVIKVFAPMPPALKK